jgi:hypothetical protein
MRGLQIASAQSPPVADRTLPMWMGVEWMIFIGDISSRDSPRQ